MADMPRFRDDPYYISPEEEAELEAGRQCQRCDGIGRIEVFHCKGICECGLCPDLEDCPECCGHDMDEAVDDEAVRQILATSDEDALAGNWPPARGLSASSVAKAE